MKLSKITTALLAVTLLTNYLFGTNSNDNKDTLEATKIVSKLSSYITLSESQKVMLYKSALNYQRKITNANTKKLSPEFKVNAIEAFNTTFDSILMPAQIDTLKLIREKRIIEVMKNTKNNRK